jgi:hypothetical protein
MQHNFYHCLFWHEPFKPVTLTLTRSLTLMAQPEEGKQEEEPDPNPNPIPNPIPNPNPNPIGRPLWQEEEGEDKGEDEGEEEGEDEGEDEGKDEAERAEAVHHLKNLFDSKLQHVSPTLTLSNPNPLEP